MKRAGLSPLIAQLAALLLLTIVLAQAITEIVIGAGRPLTPRTYTLSEVAAALAAAPASRDRALIRRRVRSLPAIFTTGARADGAERLASLLSVDAADVRFICRPASLLTNLTLGRVGASPPRSAPLGETIQGAFAVAWRREGYWLLVEPAPEWEGLRRIGLSLAAGILLVTPLGVWFALAITRPLRRLAAAAEALGRDPLAAPPALKAPAGIGEAFNLMQSRVQRFMQDRIGAFAALSHDLRTPLTRMRFRLEGADEKVRAAVLADVEQMEAMIAAVLAALRDAHAASARTPVSIGAVVARAAEAQRLAGREVEIGDAHGRRVMGDAVALERLFANIIDNAARYGARARVAFAVRGEEVETTITDVGPGLPATELERVFQPFYRSGNASEPGEGLGLWIARSIARAHGGELTLRDTSAGLVATVTLPRAPDARDRVIP
ncbi:MAG: HAMP domain-containing histidine kinase [Hyphomonadaceae bacterium]|nr:HAMP domain-containing histidine kinase [Hyphomonadaceae bacterium]